MVNFTSKANWSNLTIGPENGIEIEVEDKSHSKGKSFSKKQPEDKPLMDAIYDDG